MWRNKEKPMFTQEIRGNLARLLATENLVVEHRKVSTASFDVLSRVLTLPLWDKASNVVYDLLVGHEVGHALFTPADMWDSSIPKDFINVVEDARIEKLMKRRYAGLSKDFYNGYQELNDQDFFDISNQDISKFNLIDRINLHFKIGAYSLIPFNKQEQVFVDKVSALETFKEVIDLCRELKEFLNEQKEDTPVNLPQSSDEGQESTSVEAQSEGNGETSDDSDQDANGDGNDEAHVEPPSCGKQGGDDYESHTQRAFDESAEDLTDQRSYSPEPVYLETPEVDLSKIIVDHDKLQNYINTYWDELGNVRSPHWGNIFEEPDKQYNEFKKSSQKEVNYLVKEFECKKSADAYARTSQSKTGVLDTSKLHTYKYNDDVFKRVTVLPDGKNHGMIFILDWSGSMSNVLMDTVKQLLNLCWFCRKVQIPFEVYAFTYEWHNGVIVGDDEIDDPQHPYERKHNSLSINKRFSLLNLVTSRADSKTFDTSIRNLYRLANYYGSRGVYYHIPMGLDLSGTPLNESLITLKTLIPKFQRTSGVQKINVCILTDGEANNLSYDVELTDYIGCRSVQGNCCLRDRKLGRTYRHFDWDQKDSLSTILLENLKETFTNVNFVGFRIGSGTDFSTLYRAIHGWNYDHDAIMKQWRKLKSWELNGLGYDSLYVLGQSSLSSDVEFDVEQGAKKTAISKSFRSMLKAKTTNKKILSSFATVIS
tara:strand:- start:454 stop:2580 length:2127 start_codon:yes stop_codon:yes gene_type:complete